MAAYTFETITVAQADGYDLAVDSLSFNGAGASGALVQVLYDYERDDELESILLTFGGRSVEFGPGLAGELDIAMPDGSILAVGGNASVLETGTAGADGIYGGYGADTLQGLGGADFLHGNQGQDSLVGGAGDDMVYGGQDNDQLVMGGDTPDPFAVNFGHGNRGRDTLIGDSGRDTLLGGQDEDLLDGGLGDDNLFGDRHDDNVLGGEGNDTLIGGDGHDTLIGGGGADRIDESADDSRNLMDGGVGDDTLLGGEGSDEMQGGVGRDRLEGGDGSDELFGGDGDDVLIGGQGEDDLSGGQGQDTFRFAFGDSGIDSSEMDVITGWTSADRLAIGVSSGGGRYWEGEGTSYDNALDIAAQKASEGRDIVAVLAQGDIYLFADTDNNNVIDFGLRITVMWLTEIGEGSFVA
ncbi:MAG TPA: calcium-binding protein [Phenylobacterium sp.]